MKILCLLVSSSIILQIQNYVEFKLPFNQSDFVELNKTFGSQKTANVFLCISQYEYHGISYNVKKDAPALSIKSGIVELIGCSRTQGGFVVINHGNGIKVKYYHLKRIRLIQGEEIGQGVTIGVSSINGLATVNSIGLELTKNGNRINTSLIFR